MPLLPNLLNENKNMRYELCKCKCKIDADTNKKSDKEDMNIVFIFRSAIRKVDRMKMTCVIYL